MPLSQDDIDKLECHFKWKPEEGDADGNPQETIDHLLKNLDEYPDIKALILNVIGYLHTRLKPPQHDKAISIFDDVIQTCLNTEENQYEEYKGYEMVALCNKIHVLSTLDKQTEAEDLYKALPDYDQLSDKSRASMYGTHGYALSLFGRNKYGQSVKMYEKAIELDADNYRWHVGLSFAKGRKRRVDDGIYSQPTEIEISSLEKAIQLTNEKKSLPIALLADIYFFKGRDFPYENIIGDPRMKIKAKRLYKQAYALDPHAPHVLKRCGKAFQYLDEPDLGLACLLEAVKLDPHSSMNLHRLSQAYEKTLRDYNKAEEYYAKAVTAGRRRNFYAELDLGRIRNRMNPRYNLVKHYEDMKVHYLDDEKRIQHLEGLIQKQKQRAGGRGRGRAF